LFQFRQVLEREVEVASDTERENGADALRKFREQRFQRRAIV
jgi:hypothetical protein